MTRSRLVCSFYDKLEPKKREAIHDAIYKLIIAAGIKANRFEMFRETIWTIDDYNKYEGGCEL